MIKCAECGYENMDGLDYCDGCGAKLGAAAENGGAAESQTAPSPVAPPADAPSASAAAEAPGAESDAMGATVESSSGVSAADLVASEGAAASRAPTGELKPTVSPTPASAAPFKAKLTITRGAERRGHEFELEPGKNLIGRWDPETGSFPEVDLEQDDPEAKISRKHAMIIIENGKITIDDIGSLNGTYVNRGPRLVPGTPLDLKDGDEVIIGKTFLKLTVSPIS
jgi:FHA domain